jgi:hypothetical protein
MLVLSSRAADRAPAGLREKSGELLTRLRGSAGSRLGLTHRQPDPLGGRPHHRDDRRQRRVPSQQGLRANTHPSGIPHDGRDLTTPIPGNGYRTPQPSERSGQSVTASVQLEQGSDVRHRTLLSLAGGHTSLSGPRGVQHLIETVPTLSGLLGSRKSCLCGRARLPPDR